MKKVLISTCLLFLLTGCQQEDVFTPTTATSTPEVDEDGEVILSDYLYESVCNVFEGQKDTFGLILQDVYDEPETYRVYLEETEDSEQYAIMISKDEEDDDLDFIAIYDDTYLEFVAKVLNIDELSFYLLEDDQNVNVGSGSITEWYEQAQQDHNIIGSDDDVYVIISDEDQILFFVNE